jgi:hypothetical protein
LIITLTYSVNALAEKKTGIETAFVGYQFADLRSGNTLMEKNANKFFIPASTQKIFTALAAEKILGLDYVITNDISYTGKIQGGVYWTGMSLLLLGVIPFSQNKTLTIWRLPLAPMALIRLTVESSLRILILTI